MKRHTPGPWETTVVDHGPNGLEFMVRQATLSGDGLIVAQNVNREDRRLIAAAPELLEALEKIIHAPLYELENSILQAADVVAKARGGAR